MSNQGHAAMLQLIAEGMRTPSAGKLTREQCERVAGLLDRIAVDLLLPTPDTDDEPHHRFANEDRLGFALPN